MGSGRGRRWAEPLALDLQDELPLTRAMLVLALKPNTEHAKEPLVGRGGRSPGGRSGQVRQPPRCRVWAPPSPPRESIRGAKGRVPWGRHGAASASRFEFTEGSLGCAVCGSVYPLGALTGPASCSGPRVRVEIDWGPFVVPLNSEGGKSFPPFLLFVFCFSTKSCSIFGEPRKI